MKYIDKFSDLFLFYYSVFTIAKKITVFIKLIWINVNTVKKFQTKNETDISVEICNGSSGLIPYIKNVKVH